MDKHQQLKRIKQLIAEDQLTQATADAMRLSTNLPEEAAWHSELGLIFNQLKHYQQALELFQRAVDLAPDKGDHHYNVATVQRFLGQQHAAERSLLQAIEINRTDHQAWELLAQIKTQTLANNHISQLRDVLAQMTRPAQQVAIHFALAKELEDIGDYQASFAALQRGATLRRSHMQYSVKTDVQIMQSIAQAFPTHAFSESEQGHQAKDAIFIIGMPRTGTTLVERILANHCQVHSCGEVNNFAISMMKQINEQKLMAHDRVQLIHQSAKLDFKPLGEGYLQSMRPLRGTEPRLIDKLPFNYLYAGLIHKATPNAKIIHLQRDPMDTCFAVYKQLFQNAYPFSYQLDELAEYFIAYKQLMDHWYQAMPGVMHTVRYESLVHNPEQEIRKLLAYCDLPWQDECLSFHTNKSASTTASASQIRNPIYRSSVGKWRHYRHHLQPLADALQRAGIPTQTEELQCS